MSHVHGIIILMNYTVAHGIIFAGPKGDIMEERHTIHLFTDEKPFDIYLYEGSQGNYMQERHWHRSIEIFAIVEGELTFCLNDREYHLKAGQFMLVNSNEPHSITAEKKNYTIVLQLPLSYFKPYYTNDGFIRFSHYATFRDEEIMDLVVEMYHTYNKKTCGYEAKGQSQLYQMIYLLVTRYRELTVKVRVVEECRRRDKLSYIMNYMEEHYAEDITLESVAEEFGYSANYLSSLFRRLVGGSYKTCIDQIRLTHAHEELMHTKLSVEEIAEKNGFSGGKAFARVFSKKYGKLPGEYRRSNNE